MTREEEIKKRLFEISTSNFNNSVVDSSAYFAGYIDGAKWADSSMLAKTCEWLRDNWHKYINIDADGVVCFGHWQNDFRKAMKGE